jgi:WD40 repeat protein
MDNQNTQSAGDNAKQIGQIGQADSIDFGSGGIRVEKNANGSAIISGNDNRVVIYQYQIQRQVEEDQSAKVGEIGPNPYKGLLVFQETDGDRFFGREKQIEQLWNRFRDLHEGDSTIRLLPIYGPSGSGKSSLARAGLIPEFARRPLPGHDRARVAVLVPGTHPSEALASVLARVATNDLTPATKTREFAEELKQANEAGEYDGLRRIADLLPDIAISPLIVLVDQFEEVYSLCEKQEERDAFIGNLLTGSSSRSRRVSVIVTLRSDFLGETQKHPGLNRLFATQGFLVPAMDEEELRQAIRQPAERAGHPLDEAIVELLIKDTQGREGALPLLQFALTCIWESLTQGKEAAATLKEIGGVGGALAGEAQRIYDSLSPEEKDIARRVFLELVQLGEGSKDTRRRTEIKQIVRQRDSLEQVKQVISRFSAPGARLITLAANGNTETAEVTHEALFDHWQQLQRWLDSSRSDIRFGRRLEEAAVYWNNNGRPEGNLWRPPDLDLLRRDKERAGDDMTLLQMEFFQASELSENNRQRWRKIRIVSLVAGLIATTSSTLFALVQLQQAQHQRVEQLAIAAEALLLSQPADAVANAIAAVGLSQSALVQFPNHPLSTSAYDSLLKAIQVNHEQNRLVHEDGINSVAFSPDGKRIISGSQDNMVYLRDANTGKLIGSLEGHKEDINSVAFSPDGKRIISGSEDKTLRLWDTNTGQLIGSPLKGHEDSVTSVGFSPDGKRIISGSWDKTLRLWDANTGQPIGSPLKGHEDTVSSVAFSPDGKRIISGSWDKTLRLWDANTGQPIGSPLKGHEDTVSSVAFSPDGKRIVSGSRDKTVRLWDANTGQLIGSPLKGHEDSVFSVAFSPDGRRIVSGSRDKTVRLWDAKTGQPIGLPLKGHQDAVNSVAFSPDGKLLVSSGDTTVRLWDSNIGQPIGSPLIVQEYDVNSVRFSPDGKRIASGGGDTTVHLWDASTGQPIGLPLKGHKDTVNSVAFSPDGKWIVSGNWDMTLRLWDANTGKLIGSPLEGHEDSVFSVAFSPDGRRIVSGSRDKTVRLWDANTGKLIGSPLEGHEGSVFSVAFSPDGKHIVSGGDTTVRLWDANTGKLIGSPLEGHEGSVFSVAFSPDGKHIVSGGWDRTVRLWDANTGKLIGSLLEAHEDAVNSVAFSPDGKLLVSGSSDNTVRLWDAKTGQPIGLPLPGHQSSVTSVAFSPDGEQIISTSWDATVRLWDADLSLMLQTSLLQTACKQLRYHSILDNPVTDAAKEARKACQQYVGH